MREFQTVKAWEAVDRETFEKEILSSGKPAVLKNLAKDWPAVSAARQSNEELLNYLGKFDVGEPVIVLLGPPSIEGRFSYNEDLTGFNFRQSRAPFKQSIDLLASVMAKKDAPALYMGSTSIARVLSGMERENSIDLIDREVLPNIWIGNAVSVSSHFDTSHNIACCVAGRRRFTIFPPEQVSNLYVGPIEFNPAGQPISLASIDHPDFDKYPKFAEALDHALVADLEPGDALYMPPLWWHNVDSYSDLNILVNYWWGGRSVNAGPAMDALIHAIASIGHLPLAERKAWEGFFAHYVFNANDPAEHLPPHARGMLGELTPEVRDYVRNRIMKNMKLW